MHMKKALIAGLGATAIVGALIAPTVAAKGPPFDHGNGYRPGWGHGDDNHQHTGPPGLVDKDKPGKGPPGSDGPPGLTGNHPGKGPKK